MPGEDAAEPKAPSWGSLVRLWLLLFLSYATLKVIFNIVYLGVIDLRPIFLWEVLTLPIGQSVIVWLVARGRRQRSMAPATTP
jgi:hypothetical protein